MLPVNYLILKSSIVINYDTKTATVQKGDDVYDKALSIIRSGDLNGLIALMDKSHVIESYTPNGEFVVQNGAVFSEGERVGGYIEERLLEFAEKELPYEPLLNFWKRLRNNPSRNSCIQLYRFLEQAKCPITQRGTFIAYKSVLRRSDGTMVAHHDHSFGYTLGEPSAMDRASVVDDPDNACGQGLHVGSYEYANSFCSSDASVVLEMEVDPADVVSVPKDCQSGKCRCCLITPLAILEGGEYNTPLVAEDTGHATDTATVIKDELTINRKAYVHNVISVDDFESLHDPSRTTPIRLRPSKAPKAIRAFGTFEAGYRVADTDGVKYYMKAGDTYAAFVPKTNITITETATTDVMSPETATTDVMSPETVTFARTPYLKVCITEEQYNIDIQQGFVNVRLSKVPVCVKGCSTCYRSNYTPVEFRVVIDNKYYQVAPK